ncbi:MAG: PP2C family serine/threonine-protein phosphatase [Bacteroidales bacterium]
MANSYSWKHSYTSLFLYLRKKRGELLAFKEQAGRQAGYGNDQSTGIAITERNPWMITGASVTGHGHKAEGIPCQDAHHTEVWKNGWGVAALSDGAGTAARSHLASQWLVKKAVKEVRHLVKSRRWAQNQTLPAPEEWQHYGAGLMQSIRHSFLRFAEETGTPLYELHATLIVIIFSPHGILATHIGDGRAGCRDRHGNYHSLITPWEGEQAGQTVFVSTNAERFAKAVGIARLALAPDAFFMMTDGCERVAWKTIQLNPATGLYQKINQPFAPFFNQTLDTLRQMQTILPSRAIARNWHSYLDNGHKGFETETDDKTMVIGILRTNSYQS